jgi:hypothetical protein
MLGVDGLARIVRDVSNLPLAEMKRKSSITSQAGATDPLRMTYRWS